MKKPLFATLILTVLTLGSASAVQARPDTQIQPTAEIAATSRGLWLELKLGSCFRYASPGFFMGGASPGFHMGYKFGRLTLGAEVGMGYYSSKTTPEGIGIDYRSLSLTFVPQLQVNVVQRGPLALYLVGGAGVSFGWSKYGAASEQHNNHLAVIMRLGFGVRYFLNAHFALGLEVAADASYGRSAYDYGDDTLESDDWRLGLQGAFTAAVVF